MIEHETVAALLEAREQLDAAIELASGLRILLVPESSSSQDLFAVRGALVLIRAAVLHADALIRSILDKGR
jgi:hypothetical protein